VLKEQQEHRETQELKDLKVILGLKDLRVIQEHRD
jgi:hypothetical protein